MMIQSEPQEINNLWRIIEIVLFVTFLEIDTEVTDLLIKGAGDPLESLKFNKMDRNGVSKRDHYAAFAEVVEIGRQVIYDRTKRYAPNYMLIASDVLPILAMMDSFKAAPVGDINGPYMAGTLNAMKVFVTPNMKAGRYVLGVNGDDMMSSAAVYAPYLSANTNYSKVCRFAA